MYQKSSEIAFQGHYDGPIFVSGRSKNLKFAPGRTDSEVAPKPLGHSSETIGT